MEYVLSYWNGVDLRYRSFLDPNIRLSIAAIVLADVSRKIFFFFFCSSYYIKKKLFLILKKDVKAVPYVSNNIVSIKNYEGKRKLVDTGGVLRDEPRYFYDETYYDKKNIFLWMKKLNLEFDAAVTMTA